VVEKILWIFFIKIVVVVVEEIVVVFFGFSGLWLRRR